MSENPNLPKFVMPPKDPYVGFLTGHLFGLSDRLNYMVENTLKYGPMLHTKLGSINLYIVSHDLAVEHVLKRNARNYSKETPAYQILENVTGKGVFTESHDSWLKLRKASQPFFSNKKVPHWEKVCEKVCNDLSVELDEIHAKGEEYNFSLKMTQLTLKVLGMTIFQKDLGIYVDIMDRELGKIIDISYKMITSAMSLNFVKRYKQKKAFYECKAELDKLIKGHIDEAKKMPEDNTYNMVHAFMNAPFDIPEEEKEQFLIDQVKTMVFAGHETSSTILSWALHFISIYPEWQTKLQNEVDAVFSEGKIDASKLDDLVEIDKFVNETMRLYPPAWAFARRAMADDEILGNKIEKGDIVMVSPYLNGMNPDVWPNPHQFDPNRFNPEEVAKRHPMSFFPFGVGPRACIGEKLARMELKMIVATFMKDYNLIPSEKVKVEMIQTFTLRPKNGVFLKLEKRK